MRWPTLSAGAWKLVLAIFALCAAWLIGTEIWYAPRTLAPGAGGTLGIEYHLAPDTGRSSYVIDRIAPDSPLLAARAQVGDVWIPDRFYDALRRPEAHEPIGLTLFQGRSARRVVVHAVPDPVPADAALFIMSWSLSVAGLILGLMIGFRQPNSVALRALSLAFILGAAFPGLPSYRILPAGPNFLLHVVLSPLAIWATVILLLVFFFCFPDDQLRGTPLKRWLLRYVVPTFGVLSIVNLVNMTAVGWGNRLPIPILLSAGAAGWAMLSGVVLWNNWRSSHGDLRERHFWILLAFSAMILLAVPATRLREMTLTGAQVPWTAWWPMRASGFIVLLIFIYAVLRHRVVSIGFAVNRAVVYGVASISMLLAFGLLEWAAHHLLEFAGREKSMWLDAGIALGVFLVFHRVRNWGEQLIERLFFHAWHVKEAALRQFVKEAPFITRPEALLSAFTAALDRFTDGAGRALYRRTATGDYETISSTLPDAPARVDADEPLAVALRARQQPTHLVDNNSTLAGELALPSIHHGELDGFVVLGPKPNGDTYRPDEQEVLGFAAHQVGLDFRALRMEQLERDVHELRTRNEALTLALQRGS
jgi:hypothetical protein